MKRLTNLTAKSKNSGHAARRGVGGRASKPPAASALSHSAHRNAELERELAETRDYLQSIQEQHEAAHEELQASNEEVQSANEELQSINEELETAKEELESSNEELATVNEEMANRNTELSRLNSDLVNLETSTSLGIVLFARNLTIRRFSVRAQKQFNLMASDIGRPVRNVRHDFVFPTATSEPTDGLEAMLSEVIASVHARECDVQDKDGRCYSLRARPYFTLDNKVDGAVLVVVDITDLKRTEREIKAARDYAEAIIRTARDPLVVLRADLKVDKANDAFYKTFKITPRETENVVIYELDHGQWDIPKLRQLLGEIVSRNSPFNDFEVTHDFDRIGNRTMLLNARRLDNASGATQKILLGIEDITERSRGEEALRESEERYRTLFNLGPVGIYSVDHSGVIQDFNSRAAEIWGRKPVPGDADERFCGSFRIFRPDGTYVPHDQCPMVDVVAGKISEVRDAEAVVERPDGSRVTVLANIRPLKNDRGEVIGAINCFYEITERLRIEDALRESKALVALKQAELQIQQQRDELTRLSRLAMLGEFSASLAHELNQPLSAIMCNVGAAQYQLSRDPLDLGDVQKTLEDIVTADHRATEIIRGLRLLYRRGSAHMQPLDLNALVRDLLNLLRHDIAKWDVDLSTELASELPAVNGDAVQLQQVLLNLITNACNAMADAEPKGRKLFVRTSASPEGVRVTVADRGRGIPLEILPRIFDPFYSTRPEGMGLGLTVCHAVIGAHFGRLWAENNPDGGASFHFVLPVGESSGK